jgi:hypothetical protein
MAGAKPLSGVSAGPAAPTLATAFDIWGALESISRFRLLAKAVRLVVDERQMNRRFGARSDSRR